MGSAGRVLLADRAADRAVAPASACSDPAGRCSGFEYINLYFESRPKFYVTGTLFLPTNRSAGPVPGVLFSNGHWCLDHRDVSSVRQQNVIMNTVMLGVAVFAYDSIGTQTHCCSRRPA